jgi:hypothetical protein
MGALWRKISFSTARSSGAAQTYLTFCVGLFSETKLPVYGLLGNLTLSCVSEPHTMRMMLHRTETGWASANSHSRKVGFRITQFAEPREPSAGRAGNGNLLGETGESLRKSLAFGALRTNPIRTSLPSQSSRVCCGHEASVPWAAPPAARPNQSQVPPPARPPLW